MYIFISLNKYPQVYLSSLFSWKFLNWIYISIATWVFTQKLLMWKSFWLRNKLSVVIFMSYINGKVLLLRKEIFVALNSFFYLIFIIRSINALLINMNKTFLIANIDHISSKISLVINLVLNLSLLLILI